MTPTKELEKGLPLTGRELSQALEGTLKQRIEGPRTVFVSVTYGARPEVVFTGFWNGKFLKAVLSSISRAYRLRKYKPQARKDVSPKPKFVNTPRVIEPQVKKEA